ncbi:hypothetical protein [Synechococcus phage BUCT-ZZ01]|nr:hypothetical protein [Synechococcus phage BUCT-ZZ01]
MKKIISKSKEPIEGYELSQVIKYTSYETGFRETRYIFEKL